MRRSSSRKSAGRIRVQRATELPPPFPNTAAALLLLLLLLHLAAVLVSASRQLTRPGASVRL